MTGIGIFLKSAFSWLGYFLTRVFNVLMLGSFKEGFLSRIYNDARDKGQGYWWIVGFIDFIGGKNHCYRSWKWHQKTDEG